MSLELISTNDLLEELVRRHDAVVLTGVKFTNDRNGEYLTFCRHGGNRHACLGLLSVASHKISNEEVQMTKPFSTNEDR